MRHRPSQDSKKGAAVRPEPGQIPYLPALDGLRALAVLAVVLYHGGSRWFPGGFLGVEVFFVISGYLITSLLLSEWERSGRIDLKRFWLRRARRLFPALFLLLLGLLAFAALAVPDEVAGLRKDVAAAAGYVTNWYLILSRQSYFEAIGRPSLLRHLWSLAIEEQFYLLWPLCFAVAMRWLRQPRYVAGAILAGAAASALWMAGLYRPDVDVSRAYYGTDTRATGLLLGAALAFACRPGERARRGGPLIADGTALCALTALAGLVLWLDEYQPLLYRGGFALTGMVSALLIAAITHPNARWGSRLLGWQPLRWIGMRSYGIYLWHWPVMTLTRPGLDVSLSGGVLFALQIALTLLLAALSYRYVEMPIRQGALGRIGRSAWSEGGLQWPRPRAWHTSAGLGALVLFVILGRSVVLAERPAPPSYLAIASVDTFGARPTQATRLAADSEIACVPDESATPTPTVTMSAHLPVVEAPDSQDATSAPLVLHTTTPSPSPSPSALLVIFTPTPTSVGEAMPAAPTSTVTVPAPSATPVPSLSPGMLVSAIGDSVMIGAVEALEGRLPGIEVDAAVGRQAHALIAVLRERLEAEQLGDVVVIHGGNNGPLSAKQFDSIMEVLGDERLAVFVSVKVPREWEDASNEALAEGVERYPNAVLADWHAASQEHVDYFWGDGIHLRPEGAEIYAGLIAAAVEGGTRSAEAGQRSRENVPDGL